MVHHVRLSLFNPHRESQPKYLLGATSSGSLLVSVLVFLKRKLAACPIHIELSLALPGIAQADFFSVSPTKLDDNVTVAIATLRVLIMVFTLA